MKKRKMTNKKLTLDKVSISKLSNPHKIIGGTNGAGGDGTEDRQGNTYGGKK